MQIRITSAKPASIERNSDPYANNSFSYTDDPLVEMVRQLKNSYG